MTLAEERAPKVSRQGLRVSYPGARGSVDVSLPHELHEQQARLELDLYLRVWQSLHRWTPVEYLDDLRFPPDRRTPFSARHPLARTSSGG